jgi:hypothetical protein
MRLMSFRVKGSSSTTRMFSGGPIRISRTAAAAAALDDKAVVRTVELVASVTELSVGTVAAVMVSLLEWFGCVEVTEGDLGTEFLRATAEGRFGPSGKELTSDPQYEEVAEPGVGTTVGLEPHDDDT